MINKDKVYFIGDIHGQWQCLIKALNDIMSSENDATGLTFIQLGDFGLYKNSKRFQLIMDTVNSMLDMSKSIMYVLRGNHDNPMLFDESLNKIWKSHIIPIGQVRKIDDILFIPGGISFDRKYRSLGNTYWNEECIDLIDENWIDENKDSINYIISHVPPIILEAERKYAKFGDMNLLKDIEEERNYLKSLNDKINPKKWYAAHLHKKVENDNIIVLDIAEGLKFFK